MERKNYMRCNAETFKDIMCKVNRISPQAKIIFQSKVFHNTTDDPEFQYHDCRDIDKIEIQFADGIISERDKIIITVT